jgi:hypothetical protein
VMPVSTEFDNKDKIYKLVGYLDINEAVKLWSILLTASAVALEILNNLSTLR